jgi:hypothetical protein
MTLFTWDPVTINCAGGAALALPLVYMMFVAFTVDSGQNPEGWWNPYAETANTELWVPEVPPPGVLMILRIEARDALGRTSFGDCGASP